MDLAQCHSTRQGLMSIDGSKDFDEKLYLINWSFER